MTTETAEMFLRRAERAEAEVEALRAELQRERQESGRLAEQWSEAEDDAARLAAALGMARGFLGVAIRSPNSAAWVADEALRLHERAIGNG